jgi:hypothetical protein
LKFILSILVILALGTSGVLAQKPEQPSLPQRQPVVKFYPNPAVNFITFEFKEPVERGTVLQVYSFLGRQVSSLPVNSQRITLNLAEYFRGVYVFQLRSSSGKVLETNKFQISR